MGLKNLGGQNVLRYQLLIRERRVFYGVASAGTVHLARTHPRSLPMAENFGPFVVFHLHAEETVSRLPTAQHVNICRHVEGRRKYVPVPELVLYPQLPGKP